MRRGRSSQKRLWTGVALCLVLGPTPARALQPPPRFPTAAELVTVDVVVLDRDGKPVAGLNRDDFVVREDGRPQAVTAFEAVEALVPALASPDTVAAPAHRPRASRRMSPVRRPGAPSRSCSTTSTSAISTSSRPGARSRPSSTGTPGRATG